MLRGAYVWILRFHPRSFRQNFADEMLLIFDQVTHDEQAGSAARPRLAEIRLVADGFISLVRQWTSRPGFQPEPAVAGPTPPVPDGVPGFYTLGSFKPRPSALIHGLILSIAVLSAAFLAMKFSWNHTSHLPFPIVDREANSSSPERESAIIPAGISPASDTTQPSVENSKEEVVPPARAQARNEADQSRPRTMAAPRLTSPLTSHLIPRLTSGDDKPGDLHSKSLPMNRPGLSPPQAEQPKLKDATRAMTSAMIPAAVADVKLDAAERQRVVDRAIANLKQYYFDRDVAQKTAQALLAHEKSGDDDGATDGIAFADLLTGQMREASHDMHLVMEYSRDRLPEHPPEQTAKSLAGYRKAMLQENCGFKKVEILPHNIGYLKLNFFPDTSACQSTATTAMASLNHADAIIFDLRGNTGGIENMVALIASYLFDRPEYMYSPRASPTEQSWTRSPVEGTRLADKPAYVLTSASTCSGAEQFSYDLKMLKRATLVGETTRGSAHAGIFHRIDDHFGMGIPEVKLINPFGKADWEGTGVEPDVKVKAADALEMAEKLAESKLRNRRSRDPRRW